MRLVKYLMRLPLTGQVEFLKNAILKRGSVAASLAVFGLFAVYLFRYSLPIKTFSEELRIYDTIWLDAWSLAFILITAILWLSNLRWRTKAILGVLLLGVYGFVEIAVIFDGTPFSSYAYWGDQKFRQAMILKFMTLGYPTDFYYKGLPPFYPPVLYLIFAWLGKLASLPAYAMLKAGGMLIYLVGPFLLYWLWKPLVGSFRGWMIVLFTFMICSCTYPYMLSAPHAFVAIAIFIPWWLRYIETINGHKSGFRHCLWGGLLGAVIVTTYYYPLFVGIFLLVVRLLWQMLKRGSTRVSREFKWQRVLGVAVMSAAFSCWYWIPIVWTALTTDFNASIAQWHHIESTSLGMMFTSLTWPGLLFLAGIVFSLWRWRSPVHLVLLMFPVITLLYLLVGSVLGAIDHPINLIKARDMMVVFGGPFVGLGAAAWLRRSRWSKRRWVAPVLLAFALIVLSDDFAGYAKTGMVKTAREAYVPTWNTDSTEMASRAGSVFLCGEETFPSFYPVYTFLAANEHYSNPACQFKRRYDLLDLLEKVGDPRIVNLALRTNRYDKVDYFMPYRNESNFEITISLSNYPNQYYSRVFKYPMAMFTDTNLYRPQTGDNLYQVAEPTRGEDFKYVRRWSGDSLVELMRMALIRDDLKPDGQAEFDKYLGADWSNWRRPPEAEEAAVFGDSVQLKDLRLVADGDSLHLVMAFEALRVLSRRLKVLVHLFIDDQMTNYDFSPENPTNNWPRYETMICRQTIPRPDRPFRLYIGLYDRLGNLPGVLRVDSQPGS